MQNNISATPSLRLPRKANIKFKSGDTIWDFEQLVSNSSTSLETCRIPSSMKAYLSDSKDTGSISRKEFSVLKALGETDEKNELKCANIPLLVKYLALLPSHRV